MIHFMRNSKGLNVVKIVLFSLLILSFVAWGVGSINLSSDSQAFITINGKPIDNKNFATLYQQNIQQMAQYMPQQQIPKEYVANMVVKQLIQHAIISAYAKKIGLVATDDQVADQIKKIPFLFDSQGNFDPEKFNFALQRAGVSRDDFFNSIKEDIITQQVSGIVGFPVPLPTAIADRLYDWNYLIHVIQYISIPTNKIHVTLAPITEKQENDFYNQHKDLFAIPETRNVDILLIPAAMVKKDITVSDNEIKGFYKAHKGMFLQEETRTLNQIIVKKKADAQKAYTMIKAGTPFLNVAKSVAHMQNDAIKLGTLSHNQIPNKIIADAAFALNLNEVSQPIKTSFGWTLIQVTQINKSHIQPLSTVSDIIKKNLEQQKIGDKLSSITQHINDMISQGNTLAAVSQNLHLPLQHITDLSIKDSDDLKKFQLPDLTNRIFASDLNSVSPAIAVPHIGYLFFTVSQITPKSFATLKNSKSTIDEALNKQNRSNKITQKINSYVENINKGKSLSTFSHDVKTTSFTIADIKKQNTKITAQFLSKALSSDKKSAFSYTDDNQALIGIIKSVSLPTTKDQDKLNAFYTEVNQNRTSYVTEQYLQVLGEKVKITVNNKLIEKFLKQQQ